MKLMMVNFMMCEQNPGMVSEALLGYTGYFIIHIGAKYCSDSYVSLN